MNLENFEFAVVDVETTGLFPNGSDRILEVAVIRINGKGALLDEYVSLVNPNRDVGSTHIHGITSQQIKNAPAFKTIAGDVVSRLAGAVFVSHNVQFDFRFIKSELGRIGHEAPDVPTLCTMRLSNLLDPTLPSRKLEVCCDHFGITQEDGVQHSAYQDALSAAKLLKLCLAGKTSEDIDTILDQRIVWSVAKSAEWPILPVTGIEYLRKHASEYISSEESYIKRLVDHLPERIENPIEVSEYMEILDRCLEDRRITKGEVKLLFGTAKELGMSRDQAIKCHTGYVRDLIRLALSDDVITKSEQKDLDEVCKLLCLSDTSYMRLLQEVEEEIQLGKKTPEKLNNKLQDFTGNTICFTGTFTCMVDGDYATRNLASQKAEERGMIVKRGVTKSLDYLVAVDPDSMSGKAKKARDYGIRIIAEPVFWRMMGIEIE